MCTLSNDELLILHNLKDSLSIVQQKKLLEQLLSEYEGYRKCGTLTDCQQRKEWFDMSFEDVHKEFNFIVKGSRDEVQQIREEAVKPKTKKRGRPRKN